MSSSTFSKRRIVSAKAVDKIINCTDMPMYVYGTSGLLLELAPRVFDLSKVRLKNKGVLYVVDKYTEEKLLRIDRRFADIIVYPKYIGAGREGQKIYKFASDQENVVPISDRCGRRGDVIYN
ncbi:hypothetical protein IJG92_02995 [Candidatus Saccharibacteria bacterium]|nr:hypothetical protein [Candidatus Saccharibacteria bacterium]MBQ6149454.1 hypothetical protein [Candidatus Saccharibacteria bacterium]